jgi:hypothetical protein
MSFNLASRVVLPFEKDMNAVREALLLEFWCGRYAQDDIPGLSADERCTMLRFL